ncbi:MAG TPA: glutaredoxin domain-containing protein [Kofleriaceae bacterium]|nr:glutaredoxin domain-containing protein [Kofleriaceae bacterium]
MSWLEKARAQAHAAMTKLPGKAGELARKANDALGRPLADEDELADRKAFAARGGAAVTTASPNAATAPREVAPVVVYHMDKTRRDALKLTEILDGAGIPYKVMNIQEDPAAQMAVKRDSGPHRLPVVFIAGEVIGGRGELLSLQASGQLKKKVFGA